MELILGIGLLALFGKKFISTIKSVAVFFIILVMSLVLTFMYSIPYISSLAICIILKYGIKDLFLSIGDLSKSLIISKYRYNYEGIQKLVNVLLNCNYLAFILLSYIFIVREIINQYFTFDRVEAITLGIIVVALNKILGIIIHRFINKKIFIY